MTIDEQIRATAAAAATIRDLGQVAAGHLYNALMVSTGITFDEFETLIAVLKESKLIKYGKNHLITWIGPPIKES